MEGGSKRTIEAEWNLDDIHMLRRYWRKNGPPMHIAATVIAAALGADLTGHREGADGEPELDPAASAKPLPGGLSIAELSERIRKPVDQYDTVASTMHLQRLLEGGTSL